MFARFWDYLPLLVLIFNVVFAACHYFVLLVFLVVFAFVHVCPLLFLYVFVRVKKKSPSKRTCT